MALIRHLQDQGHYRSDVYSNEQQLEVLCENLNKVLQAKDEEINRINRHCEYLMQLYYESEEQLAMRGAELFKMKARLEMCTCIPHKNPMVNGLNKDTMADKVLYTDPPVRHSLDSKTQINGFNMSSEINESSQLTSKSSCFPRNTKSSSDDFYVNHNSAVNIDNMHLERSPQSPISDQTDDFSPLSTRQSLSTGGWSDLSQFIDDSPLLNISRNFSIDERPFSVSMSDRVSSSRADVLIVDHNLPNDSPDESETSANDVHEDTVRYISSDDEEEVKGSNYHDVNHNTDNEAIHAVVLTNSVKEQPREDTGGGESGYDTAIDSKPGFNAQYSLSEESGLEENPNISGKRLKPKAISYSFDILPSKTSSHLPIASKNCRKSVNLQSMKQCHTSKHGITDESKSTGKLMPHKSCRQSNNKLSGSLNPVKAINPKVCETKSMNFHTNYKKEDVSPPPLERKSTYTKEEIEAEIQKMEKSQSLSMKDTYTKEDFDREIQQLEKTESINLHNDTKTEKCDDDQLLKIKVDEMFKENGRQPHLSKSLTARDVKQDNQCLTEPPRPLTANSHLNKTKSLSNLELNYNLERNVNQNSDLKENTPASEVENNKDVDTDPVYRKSLNKPVLRLRPSQPKPIASSMDTNLHKIQHPPRKITRSVELQGNFEGIISPRTFVAHMKCNINDKSPPVDSVDHGGILLGNHDKQPSLQPGTILIPHAPTARKCATPNPYRRKNVEQLNDVSKTWTQLFS